jgi:hypothetical protein
MSAFRPRALCASTNAVASGIENVLSFSPKKMIPGSVIVSSGAAPFGGNP